MTETSKVDRAEAMHSPEALKALYRDLAVFERPNLRRAVWQLCNTFLPYFALWGLMIYTRTHGYPYWITFALGVLTTPFWVRIFIVFHDCGHGSYFKSTWANRILGHIAGVLTFAPHEDWRRIHNAHHATSGDLDRRPYGDVWTLTVAEYRALPAHMRLAYRFYRNPIVLFVLGPALVMLIVQRFWQPGARNRERVSVMVTNVGVLGIILAAHYSIGLRTYWSIQAPIVMMAGAVGLWLVYVQHQFDGAHWARHEDWSWVQAALQGSSYYKLPGWLQWCTGNIGIHHIHHLRPRIPNYNLQPCFDAVPLMQQVTPMTLRDSLRCASLNLWDEEQGRLVSFSELRQLSGSARDNAAAS